MRLYRWIATEIPSDERPSDAVVENDKELDNWLESYHRLKAQEAAAAKARRNKPHGS